MASGQIASGGATPGSAGYGIFDAATGTIGEIDNKTSGTISSIDNLGMIGGGAPNQIGLASSSVITTLTNS